MYVPRLWLTNDLTNWVEASFPNTGGKIDNLVHFSDGYFLNSIPCVNGGDYCEPAAHRQFLSDDGMDWTELPPSFDEYEQILVAVADEMLAVLWGDSSVWRFVGI